MKTIKYSIILVCIALLSTTCMEDFLTEEVYSDLSPSNFYQTEADALSAVNAVYNSYQYFGNELWSVGNAYMSVTDGVTDIMHLQWYAPIENLTFQSTNWMFLDLWNHCYNTNNKANVAIARIPDIEMNEELKTRLIAEVKFLRAFNYFNAVRWWGDVPLILEAIENFNDIENVSQAPKSQVYDRIIQDLQDAINILPPSYDSPDDAGRAAKGAAKTLLGKVYLTRGWGGGPDNINTADLQLAIDEFEDLMAAPYTYTLADSITETFDYTLENSPELGHIFSQQYSQGLGYEGTWIAQNMQAMELESAWWGFSAPESWIQGSGGYEINWVDGWDPVPVDKRLKYLWENYTDLWWYYWCKKWQYESYQGWAEHPQNFTMLRWADVLLMHSEALNELNGVDAGTVASINLVRERAGVAQYDPAGWTKETFRDEIQNERSRELWGECHAWFDYVRKGMFVERMQAAGFDFVDDKFNLYPIPKQELDNNPNLTQNTGW